LKKYQPSGNLKFSNLGIFQSLKLRISIKKILPISIKLNFQMLKIPHFNEKILPISIKLNFPKLKIARFNEKILPISIKLNFTPNRLGCYGVNPLLPSDAVTKKKKIV